MKHLNFLLKLSSLTLISSSFLVSNVVFASSESESESEDGAITGNKQIINQHDTVNVDSKNEWIGRIVNNAFNTNINTVAGIVENNKTKYKKALVDDVYWAKSEKFSGSIENLSKLFTFVYCNPNLNFGKEAKYYRSVIESQNRGIVIALNTFNNRGESTNGNEVNKRLDKTEPGKKVLSLVNGLVAFRTLYNFKTKIISGTVNTDLMERLFDDVFNAMKNDEWYTRVIEHFDNNEERFKKYIRHDWDCYFNQFFVLMGGKFENTDITSIANKVEQKLKDRKEDEERRDKLANIGMKLKERKKDPNLVYSKNKHDRLKKDISYRERVRSANVGHSQIDENLTERECIYLKQADLYLSKAGVIKDSIIDLYNKEKNNTKQNQQRSYHNLLKDCFEGLKTNGVLPEKFAKDFILAKYYLEDIGNESKTSFLNLITVIHDMNLRNGDKSSKSAFYSQKENYGNSDRWLKLRLASIYLRGQGKISEFIKINNGKISLSKRVNSIITNLLLIGKQQCEQIKSTAHYSVKNIVDFLYEILLDNYASYSDMHKLILKYKELQTLSEGDDRIESLVWVANHVNKQKGTNYLSFIDFIEKLWISTDGSYNESCRLLFGVNREYGTQCKTLSDYSSVLDDYIKNHDDILVKQKGWTYFCKLLQEIQSKINNAYEKRKNTEKCRTNQCRSRYTEKKIDSNITRDYVISLLQKRYKDRHVIYLENFNSSVRRGLRTLTNNLIRAYNTVINTLEELSSENSSDINVDNLFSIYIVDILMKMPVYNKITINPKTLVNENDTDTKQLLDVLTRIYIDLHYPCLFEKCSKDVSFLKTMAEIMRKKFLPTLSTFFKNIDDKHKSYVGRYLSYIIYNLTATVSSRVKVSYVEEICNCITNDDCFKLDQVQCINLYAGVTQYFFERKISGTFDELLDLAKKLVKLTTLNDHNANSFDYETIEYDMEQWRTNDSEYIKEFLLSLVKDIKI